VTGRTSATLPAATKDVAQVRAMMNDPGRRREQTRARYPDETGFIERNGGRVYWEAYGTGEPPIVFVPPWQVVHSRTWKAQIPDFARRHRVVAWDNRGNGRSDRPRDPMVHVTRERAANLIAVMDAAGVAAAVLVGVSSSSGPMTVLGAEHPERVLGLVYICPASPFGEPSYKGSASFDDRLPDEDGWNQENIHVWRRDFAGYLEFFFGEAYPEPHSTKPIEDGVGWGLESDVETLAATVRTPPTLDHQTFTAMCAAIRAPTIVIQGTDERVAHVSQGIGLANAIPGARLERIESGGHLVHAREPVRVNLLIREFIRRLEGSS
jgi:pimeloyl-ACP methyl ester carboxylesterase